MLYCSAELSFAPIRTSGTWAIRVGGTIRSALTGATGAPETIWATGPLAGTIRAPESIRPALPLAGPIRAAETVRTTLPWARAAWAAETIRAIGALPGPAEAGAATLAATLRGHVFLAGNFAVAVAIQFGQCTGGIFQFNGRNDTVTVGIQCFSQRTARGEFATGATWAPARASGESTLAGASETGAPTLATLARLTRSSTGPLARAFAGAAWALIRVTGTGTTTGPTGSGLVALLFTEKILYLLAAGAFIFLDAAIAVFIKLFEEQFADIGLATGAIIGTGAVLGLSGGLHAQ